MPCLQHRKTLRRLTSWTRCQASSEVSSTEESSVGLMPALLNRTSMRPSSSRARSYIPRDLLLVGHVRLERQLALRARIEVHAHDPGALRREQPRGLGPDAAGGARDHADLPLEPSRHQPSSVA